MTLFTTFVISRVQETIRWIGLLTAFKVGFVLALLLANIFFLRRLRREGNQVICRGCSIIASVTAVNIIHSALCMVDVLTDSVFTLPATWSETITCSRQLCLIHLLSFIQLVNFAFLLQDTVKLKSSNRLNAKGLASKGISLTPIWLVSTICYSIAFAFNRKDMFLKVGSTKVLTFPDMDINLVICREEIKGWRNTLCLHGLLVGMVVVAFIADLFICYRAGKQAFEPAQELNVEYARIASDPEEVHDLDDISTSEANHSEKCSTQLPAKTGPHVTDKHNASCIYENIQAALFALLSTNVLWQVLLRPVIIFYLGWVNDRNTYIDIGTDVTLGIIAVFLPILNVIIKI